MGNKGRWLALLLAAVTLCGALTACAKRDADASPAGGNGAESTEPVKDAQYLAEQAREIRSLVRAGDMAGAKERSDLLLADFPDDPTAQNLAFSTSDTVLYEGPIEHIFFHPLIAYVERATDGRGNDSGQDLYMVTVEEFNRTITQMYEKGYVLTSMYDLFSFETQEDGTVFAEKKPLYLPQGKKPYILSVDDMNYYEYMIADGQVWKLVFDDNGEIAAYAENMDGVPEVRRDNAIVPLLDDFVKAHPDASYNGAKGLIGLTGYEGILGYRTNSIKYENYLEEQAAVKPIVAQLKETGWDFASHSQGHRHTNTAAYEVITEDTDRWAFEVEPLVGKTPIYIYPFGETVKDDDPKMAYLRKYGFAVFCGVGNKPYLKQTEGGFIKMDRRAIDGVTLRKDRNADLLDAAQIVDASYRTWYPEFAKAHGIG